MSECRLRTATRRDARLLWRWSNDAVVRANSFRPEPIAWETHCAWLDEKLVSRDCRLWILVCEGRRVGQIRYDRVGRSGAAAEISFAIAAPFRGRGLGTEIVRQSLGRACRELGVRRIVALVKPENEPSKRVFERLGFRHIGSVVHRGVACVRLERRCSAPGKTGPGSPADR